MNTREKQKVEIRTFGNSVGGVKVYFTGSGEAFRVLDKKYNIFLDRWIIKKVDSLIKESKSEEKEFTFTQEELIAGAIVEIKDQIECDTKLCNLHKDNIATLKKFLEDEEAMSDANPNKTSNA